MAGIQLRSWVEGFQREQPYDQVGLVAQGVIEQQQVFGQRHGGIAEVIGRTRLPSAVRSGSPVDLSGQRVLRLAARCPTPTNRPSAARGIHPALVGPGQHVRGEHRVELVQAQVIGRAGIFAIGQPLAAVEQAL